MIGPPPPWAHLDRAELQFDLDEIRRALSARDPQRFGHRSPDARDAAVLVTLFERDADTKVVLTKRPETMPSHQGEIAFPGGKHDAALDGDLAATALREAHEEIGLDPGAVEVVSQLDTLSTVASQFVITPFVGFVDEPPDLVAHPREVVKVFEVSLGELFDPQTHHSEIWSFERLGQTMTTHFFELPGETVWGATARILANLLAVLAATR